MRHGGEIFAMRVQHAYERRQTVKKREMTEHHVKLIDTDSSKIAEHVDEVSNRATSHLTPMRTIHRPGANENNKMLIRVPRGQGVSLRYCNGTILKCL